MQVFEKLLTPIRRWFRKGTKEQIRIWKDGEVIENRYRVLGHAAGRMGVVYFVYHLQWNRTLAVKSPHYEILQHRGGYEQFQREAASWVELGKHPNVVNAYYVRKTEGLLRIFMEYVDGTSLNTILEKKGALPYPILLDYAIQICDGITHAHDKKLIHRDLKAENCLIDKENTLKITDLGLVKGIHNTPLSEPLFIANGRKLDAPSMFIMDDEQVVMGSPPYMAPEMWGKAHEAGIPADVYSFGVLLFEMVCGHRPYQAPSPGEYRILHLNSRIPSPHDFRSDLDDILNGIIVQCLQKKPTDRYASFKEIRNSLATLYQKITGETYQDRYQPVERERIDDLNCKALSYIDLDNEEEAFRILSHLTETYPYYFYSAINLALLYLLHYPFTTEQRALELIQSAIQNNPSQQGEGYYYLGLVHTLVGNYLAAIHTLDKSLKQGYNEAKVYNLLGIASSGIYSYDESTHYFTQASSNHSAAIYAWNTKSLHATLTNTSTHKIPLTSLMGSFQKIPVYPLKPLFQKELYAPFCVDPTGTFCIAVTDQHTCATFDPMNHERMQTLARHTNTITSLKLSHQGTYILSSSADHTIQVWDAETFYPIKTLRGHSLRIRQLKTDRQEKYLYSISDDYTIKKWSLFTFECVQTWEGHQGQLTHMELDEDQGILITSSRDTTVRVWDYQQQTVGHCIRLLEYHHYPIEFFIWTNSPYFITADTGGTVVAWEKETWEVVYSWSTEGIQFSEMIYHESLRWIIVGDTYGQFHFFPLDNPKQPWIMQAHEHRITDLSISPDETFLLSGCESGTLRIWQLQPFRCIKYAQVLDGSVDQIQWEQSKQLLILASNMHTYGEYTLRAYTMNLSNPTHVFIHPVEEFVMERVPTLKEEQKKEQETEQLLTNMEQQLRLNQFKKALHAISALQNLTNKRHDYRWHKELFTIQEHATNQVLKDIFFIREIQSEYWVPTLDYYERAHALILAHGKPNPTILFECGLKNEVSYSAHTNRIRSFAIHPSTSTVYTGAADHSIQTFLLIEQKKSFQKTGFSYPIHHLKIHTSMNVLLLVERNTDGNTREERLHVLQLPSLESLYEEQRSDCYINTIGVVPWTPLVIAGFTDGTLRFFDLQKNRWTKTIQAHDLGVGHLSLFEHQKQGITWGFDSVLTVWDASTWESQLRVPGTYTYVVLPKTNLLIVQSINPFQLQIWDLHTRTIIQTLGGFMTRLNILRVDRFEHYLFGGDEAGTLYVWRIKDGKLIQKKPIHSAAITDIILLEHDLLLATTSLDRNVQIGLLDWVLTFS
jgi:serine/threonine protein kinase